ncbi:MAG: DHHA1 domain-containing protein, partial [Bacillus sp. (in: firmicutes)]
ITVTFEDKSFADLKNLANLITEKKEACLLLATTSENKILLTCNGSQDISCGKLFKEHLLAYNGKGGGNDHSAQAAFATTEELMNFFAFISGIIK